MGECADEAYASRKDLPICRIAASDRHKCNVSETVRMLLCATRLTELQCYN